MAKQSKRLYRSQSDRMVAGVLGGVASYFGIDPSLLRIAYLILTLLTGGIGGVLIYLLMAIIIPEEPQGGGPPGALA